MIDQVRALISRHRMLLNGDRVIVSVSGGPDSVALLHILHQLAPEIGISLHVFHLDHGLRGEQSAEDALYVRDLATKLGLASTIIGIGSDVLKRRGGSLQAAARQVRLEELFALSKRLGGAKVAQGHNQNDQAETVLMRLIRGSGSAGLKGISPVRLLQGVSFIRPLLATSRHEIEQYCREFELSPRHDSSNLRPDYLRNRIRLDLLPKLISEYNPSIIEGLAQTAELLREDESLLESLAMQAMSRCKSSRVQGSLSGPALLSEPLPIARRVIRLAAQAVCPNLDLGLHHVSAILELAHRSEGTYSLNLPSGVVVTTEYGTLRFWPGAAQGAKSASKEWPLAPAGLTHIPEIGISVLVSAEGLPDGAFEAAFDQDLLPGPLSVRFRRPGDRMWPVGMDGSKKLQDIFVDEKVPRRLRDQLPLVAAGGEVLWIIGFRLDRRYLAHAGTRNLLLVKVLADPMNPRNALGSTPSEN